MAQLTANPTTTSETNGWGVLIDGGYIKKAPHNPAAPSTDQCKISAAGGAGFGWEYVVATGTLGATYYDEVNDLLTPGVP
jgi:hypothetical protein